MLRAVLRPFLVLKRRWFVDDAEDHTSVPDAEVHWNAREESLTAHVNKAVETAPAGDLALGTLLEDCLIGAYDLLEAYHGDLRWDRLSHRRSAIEPHQQDEFREPVDAVIDGLRGYGEKAMPYRADLPERWWSLGRVVLQRLALHLLAADESRGPDEKIQWLLDRSILYDADLKHEVYRVLQTSVGAANQQVLSRLLEVANAGPKLPEHIPDLPRHIAYGTYNLLVWLTRAAPGWSDAAHALAALQAANPDFAPRDHPDFDRWMTSGWRGDRLPMEPEDFANALSTDANAALDDLLNRDYSELNFSDPRWSDALSLISRVTETKPALGEQLWTLIERRTGLDSRADDLRRAIIEGWAAANLADFADAAVARVATQVTNPESARSVSRFLLEQNRKQVENDETPALAAMRKTALELWQQMGSSFAHSQGADVVSSAALYLNSWPGDLALYWMTEVDRRWRRHRDDWSGLSDEERGAFVQLLEAPRHARDATEPALASGLFFMFAADPEFATQRILPLFRDDATARLAWTAYLYSPRYNDRLLAAGLLDSVDAQWERLDMLDKALQNNFLGLAASIVTFAGIDTASTQALLDRSVLAAEGSHAAEFAEAVVRLLTDNDTDGAEVWNRWLHDHVASRLNGLPRVAEPEEAARWADAVPYLGEAIQDAVRLFSGRGIGLGDRFFGPDLPEGVLAAHGFALVQHYAERVGNSSPSGYFAAHQVRDLIEAMRQALGDVAVQPLVVAARERGFIGGSD